MILAQAPRRVLRAARRLKSKLSEYAASRSNVRRISFLHIGKNAGTQFNLIAHQINQAQNSIHIEKAAHHKGLADLGENEEFLFSIRSPVTRYSSGFYSRKRKGQPRIYSEWSAHEERAFAEFEHANDLAEALFTDGDLGLSAFSAMKSIRHCAMDQVKWFDLLGAFFDVRPPLMIIRQEHFEKDIETFRRLLGLDFAFELTSDPVKAHRNDYSDTPPMSPKAVANLERWYCQDAEFYRVCETWLEREGLA